MTGTAGRPPHMDEIVHAITEYSCSAIVGSRISLRAAIHHLRAVFPDLGLSDRALASLVAEAAFKNGCFVRMDLALDE